MGDSNSSNNSRRDGPAKLICEIVNAGEITTDVGCGSVSLNFSSKRNFICVVETGIADNKRGPVKSGFDAITEFSEPGVPPLACSEATQFSSSAQMFSGSINSSVQPPCFLSSSLYQASV